MVDIMVAANGYKADEAVELVTRPLEDIIKGIDGVEHVYSQTEDDRVVVTARFLVGTDEDTAVLRVHEKIRAAIDDIPKGIPEPLIVGRGINDVAIRRPDAVRQADKAGEWTDNGLATGRRGAAARADQGRRRRARPISSAGAPSEIRVEPDPERLALYGMTLSQVTDKLANANRSFLAGAFRDNGPSVPVVAGQTLQGVPDIGLLLLTSRDGRPVYVKDVADVVVGSAEADHRAWTMTRDASGALDRRPAVSLAIAKRKGANAVTGRRRRDEAPRDDQGPHRPCGPRRHGHARLRRDRERQGERTPVPSRARDRLRSSSSSPRRSAGARASWS